MSILYCFRDFYSEFVCRQSQSRKFFPVPHVFSAPPPLEMILFDFNDIFVTVKQESMGCCAALFAWWYLSRFDRTRDCDRRTQTDRHRAMAYIALA